jgi:BMFP domain-containing protein YqiC
MAEYNRELRDVIKSMFEKERQKNDNLMMKYAQLESESNTLRQRLAERNSDNRRQHH